jgi:4-amino-4-deoxy-L-arabinose transferase-like glycosyltransferase
MSGEKIKEEVLLKKFRDKRSILLLIILLVGIGTRFYDLGDSGIKYWDAGYYSEGAKTIYHVTPIILKHLFKGDLKETLNKFVEEEKPTPIAGLKPAHIFLISLSFFALGVHDYSAIFVSALSGVLTVLLVYLIGKKLYNKNVGIVAAAFFSVMEYSILYSRSALSESNLMFFFCLSIYVYILVREEDGFFYRLSKRLNFNFRVMNIFILSVLGTFTMFVNYKAFFIFPLLFLFEVSSILYKKRIRNLKKIVLISIIVVLIFFSINFFIQSFQNKFRDEIIGATEGRSFGHLFEDFNFGFYLIETTLFSYLSLFFLLVGVIVCLWKRKQNDLFLLAWFFSVYLFWSSFAHFEPRDFAIAVPAIVLLAGRVLDVIKINKKIKFHWFSIFVLLVLTNGVLHSWDTLFLKSDYKPAAEFIKNQGGSLVYSGVYPIFKFYGLESRGLTREELNEEEISDLIDKDAYLVVDRFVSYHGNPKWIMEIMKEIQPAYKIKSNINNNLPVVLESLSKDYMVKDLKKRSYYNYTLVYRLKDLS